MLQALLFDLDGTLADTDPIHFQTWKDVLREYGLEFDHAFYQTHFSGRLNSAIVKDLLPHLSLEAGEQLGNDKEAEYRRRAAKQLKPLVGLLDSRILSISSSGNAKTEACQKLTELIRENDIKFNKFNRIKLILCSIITPKIKRDKNIANLKYIYPENLV
ncbi:MAG: HAD hydrolase-like protein [Coleofasciculus sp. G3-WIS-01]|uniref:HAD family hydrolase n=1 Tax=Coleofasciculus sp. G3-WIS-01 TaxID=3069528 RepID=UPI0032F9B80C